jgi:hypothetical protein
LVKSFYADGRTLHEAEAEVEALIRRYEPILVIVDGFKAAFGNRDTDDADVISNYRLLRKLGRGERAVLVLHHVSTSGQRDAGNGKAPEPAGVRTVRSQAGHVVYLRVDKKGQGVLATQKSNYLPGEAPVPVLRSTDGPAPIFTNGTSISLETGDGTNRVRKRKNRGPELVLREALEYHGGSCQVSDLKRFGSKVWGVCDRTAGNRLGQAIDKADGKWIRVKKAHPSNIVELIQGIAGTGI